MRGIEWLVAIILTSGVTACSDGRSTAGSAAAEPQSKPASITGTISYRSRIALTNEAVAVVRLEDVSRQDAPAVLLAEQIIVSPGQVPIRFSLEYSRAAIDPRLSYVLRAHITDRGRLLFTTDTHMPVLTRGAGDEAHLLLVQVADVAAPPAAPTIARAAGTPLRGMFRYLADAAWFRDCRTGQAYPVAMEGAYIEAERAYLNSGIEAGTELMIEVDGRYQERPSMEGKHNEINLIIDSFNNLLPDNTCAQETSRR